MSTTMSSSQVMMERKKTSAITGMLAKRNSSKERATGPLFLNLSVQGCNDRHRICFTVAKDGDAERVRREVENLR